MRRVTTFCILVSSILLLLHGARSEHAFCENAREIPQLVENDAYTNTKQERPISLYSEENKLKKGSIQTDLRTHTPFNAKDIQHKPTHIRRRHIPISRRLSNRRYRMTETLYARMLSRRNMSLRLRISRLRKVSDRQMQRREFRRSRNVSKTNNNNRRQHNSLATIQKPTVRRFERNVRSFREQMRKIKNKEVETYPKTTIRRQIYLNRFRDQRLRQTSDRRRVKFDRRLRIFESLQRRQASALSRRERKTRTAARNRLSELRLRRTRRSRDIFRAQRFQRRTSVVDIRTNERTTQQRLRQIRLRRRNANGANALIKIVALSEANGSGGTIIKFQRNRRLRTSRWMSERRREVGRTSSQRIFRVGDENTDINTEKGKTPAIRSTRIQRRLLFSRRNNKSEKRRGRSTVDKYRRSRNSRKLDYSYSHIHEKSPASNEIRMFRRLHVAREKTANRKNRETLHDIEKVFVHRRYVARIRRHMTVGNLAKKINLRKFSETEIRSLRRRSRNLRENNRIQRVIGRFRSDSKRRDRTTRQYRRVRREINLGSFSGKNGVRTLRISGIKNQRERLNRRNALRYNRHPDLTRNKNTNLFRYRRQESRRLRNYHRKRNIRMRNQRNGQGIFQNLFSHNFEDFLADGGKFTFMHNKSSEANLGYISSRRLVRLNREIQQSITSKNEGNINGGIETNSKLNIQKLPAINNAPNRWSKSRRSRNRQSRIRQATKDNELIPISDNIMVRPVKLKTNKRTRQRRNQLNNALSQVRTNPDFQMMSIQAVLGQKQHRINNRARSANRLSRVVPGNRKAYFHRYGSDHIKSPPILDVKRKKDADLNDKIETISFRKGQYENEESIFDFAGISRGMVFGLLGLLGTRMSGV